MCETNKLYLIRGSILIIHQLSLETLTENQYGNGNRNCSSGAKLGNQVVQ